MGKKRQYRSGDVPLVGDRIAVTRDVPHKRNTPLHCYLICGEELRVTSVVENGVRVERLPNSIEPRSAPLDCVFREKNFDLVERA